MADAAVLGTTFPAEALIAVSGRDEPSVRAALADLVRREVLRVSGDPLSPERGNYQFAQEMLRQVAYDTLSRRDRKAGHLAVAAHLRATFPGGGEEMADVIARHYLDALHAIPDDPDAGQIRGQAIAALIRAAERSERTGAPGAAAASYATAADLIPATPAGAAGTPATGQPDAGTLWERAARAVIVPGDYAAAVEYADRARDHYLRRGQDRAAARTQAIAGRALRIWGRHAGARERLSAAAKVLRADPDTDTVRVLEELAALEMFAGSPDADRLTAEALILGQALGVGSGQLASLFLTRGIYLCMVNRGPEGVAYFREGARLATQAGDNVMVGRALANMSDALAVTDPAAAADAARTAAGHLRRAGARDLLAVATMNLVQALLQLGDWDGAEAEITQAMDSGGLTDDQFVICDRGWLVALRGDADAAEAMLASLGDLRASEDLQDKSLMSTVEAFAAAARRQPADALRHARAALTHADALGISFESLRWAWPLAARAAFELQDSVAISELLTLLDSSQPGHIAAMLRAERDLVRARLAATEGDAAAAGAFAAAITHLREQSTPYHLAHGLLDQAGYLTRHGDADAAAEAIDEARVIGRRLRCQPLLDRADDIEEAKPRIRA
jgi:tetratricopeptide (TPR) repeat protein